MTGISSLGTRTAMRAGPMTREPFQASAQVPSGT